MPDDRERFLERSAKSLQEDLVRSSSAAGAGYTLIGAILFLGAIGFAVDRWQGTTPWFLTGGLILGVVVGFYELAKTVWPGRSSRGSK
jgi:F0F1-type ATP synthase assembly protein I